MSLFGLFRRKPPIRDAAALAEFIDEHSAFLAQKGIYEYSRARAGPYSKVLFAEPAFVEAVEAARWRAYPLALAMVAEMVVGVLDRQMGADRPSALAAASALALAAFDHYPVPATLGDATWAGLRDELARQLALIGTHPRKLVKDIPERYADAYCALMPIHEKLRGRDDPTLRNYLRVTLCNIHDELAKRMDVAALAAALRPAAGTQPASGG